MRKQLVFGLVAMLALGSGAALAQSAPSGDGNGGGNGGGYIIPQAKPKDGRNGSKTYHPECKGMHCALLLVTCFSSDC